MTGIALEDFVVEVLHYFDDDSPPGWSAGSGFLVGGALVLTAAHNVGDGKLLVRVRGAERPATVLLRGSEESADLALVEITGASIDGPRFRYGRVDRTVPGFVDRCWAIGFPAYKERVFGHRDAPPRPEPERRTTHVKGQVPTGENLGLDLLTLLVHHTPVTQRGRQSEWSGMSGSVVFADEDIVVGVISEHHRPEGSSSLAVVPITAIDRLPDAEAWWQLLGADPSGLVRLPLPARRNDGLYVWTAADSQAGREVIPDTGDVELLEAGQPVDVTALRRGQLPNLQLEFRHLGQRFDEWLTPGPSRKTGMERLRVLWLVGDPAPERSKALLACLSRAGQQGRAVYDASRDLSLAAETLGRSIFAAGFALSPLISVDLKGEQPGSPWSIVETAVTNARKQFAGPDGQHLRGDDPYPRMIVAGTVEQEAAAAKLLYGVVDIMAVDRSGIVQQREYALINQIPTGKHVYNRGLPITARNLFGRRREIQTFRRDWESEQIRVLSVVAYGGTGKSALVNAWLHEMQQRDYGGARRVLAWSFYSQGTKENLVSADLFVSTALTWLGDESPPSLNLWARGLQLARLIKRNRFLLVLDGLEPLQYPITASLVGGQLTDDSIRALLEELAKPDWEGLCLITTRVPLTDLGRFQVDRDEPAGQGTVDRLDLENLSEEDAADLLEYLIGAEADYRDLKAAVREVDCHALAITLLGNYLRDVHGGDLTGRRNLDRLTVDVREGGHARRIMATYATWLERNERFAELTILRLIGLFDRPADPDAMAALLADPQMRTFTGKLGQGSDAWNDAVDALREMGLLNREFPDQPGTLDAHPLVREHFRYELRKDHPNWWLQGNRTLFGYYQTLPPTPTPENSKDMNWLYAAVTHGCAAGLHQQVFDEVLLTRVWRDRRTNFSTRRLGMTGSDLVALSNYFYPQQWTTLRTPSLSARARVLVLTNAGVRLRQLGRLVDARDSFGAVVREIDPQAAQAEELEDASYATAAYCELLVIAGKLKGGADESEGALFNGQRAVEFSNQGDDAYFSMHARISLAEVYFMLNDLEQANALFEQAMAIDRERRPRPPFLYSQGMYRYGYFLIETDRAEMILTGESQDPSWGKNGEDSSLLSEAIRLLILGAAHRALIEAGPRDPAFLRKGEQILNDAISAFQTAGYTDYTVRGLLERAHFYRALGQTRYNAEALADLARAAVEAKRGQMDLLYADVLMQQVACYLDEWAVMTTSERSSHRDKITDSLNLAADLVTTIGYGRRQAMLASLQEAAAKAGALRLPPPAQDVASHARLARCRRESELAACYADPDYQTAMTEGRWQGARRDTCRKAMDARGRLRIHPGQSAHPVRRRPSLAKRRSPAGGAHPPGRARW